MCNIPPPDAVIWHSRREIIVDDVLQTEFETMSDRLANQAECGDAFKASLQGGGFRTREPDKPAPANVGLHAH